MKKKLWMAAAVITLSVVGGSTIWAAGWGQDERGYWYQNPTGSYARGGFSTIDGVMYAFDGEGYMVTGWQSQDGKWYYFEPEGGAQAIGWKQIDGKWYFFDQDKGGAMHIGWKTEGNKTYYFGNDGAMYVKREFCTCDASENGGGNGYTYEASEDGSILKNTVDEARKLIYDENGRVKMKDALTIASGAATGEQFYQYAMCEHYMGRNTQMQIDDVRAAVGEHLEKYAEKYDEDVRNAKSSKREERFATWKERLLKGMQSRVKGTVYEADLEAYIEAVMNNTFENADEFVDDLPANYFSGD